MYICLHVKYPLLLSNCNLLLNNRYNSCRVLAFSTIFFHSRRSWACSDHLMSFILLRSFLTSSSHLCLGLPAGRVTYGCHLYIFLTIIVSGFLRTCPNQPNLWALTLFITFRCEVTGEWRKLHNEELSDLYSLPNIVRVVKSRRMRWAGHMARMGEGRGVHRVLVGKPEEKRPLGRPRRRWEDNIKMDLQEVGGSCEDWMQLTQDRDRWWSLVGTVMNLRVPKMRGIS